MRLTRFTNYSLRVLIYLGQNKESRVTINQISEDYDISKNHLMKVVSNLTRLQFVAAQRGPGGGIQLNRSPADINLNEIIANTEKHLQDLDAKLMCTSMCDSEESTADSRLCSLLQHALQIYLNELGRFTLADILDPNNDMTQLLELNSQVA